MTEPRKLLLIASLLGCVLAGETSAFGQTTASWVDSLHLTASASGQWTENMSRTSYEPTRKSGSSYELSLNGTQPRQLAPDWLLTLGGGADFTGSPDFPLTDNLAIGPQVGLQRKFGLGPQAPVLQFSTAYTYKAARLAADRGGTLEANLRLVKRLGSSVKVAVSGQWLKHYAESDIFDIQQRTLSVEVSWDIDEHWRLSASAGRLDGTIVANAAAFVYYTALSGGFGPAIKNYYTAIPWGETDLYGDDWISYTVGAHADLWSASLAYAVSDRTTLELSNHSVFVVNRVKVRYPTDSIGISLIHRF